MKTRQGFISNSSSSSFIIKKKYLSPVQIEQIREFQYWGEKLDVAYADDDFWRITENARMIRGDTIMDNFDFAEFLEKIGVRSEYIEWGDCDFRCYDWSEWEDGDLEQLEKENDNED